MGSNGDSSTVPHSEVKFVLWVVSVVIVLLTAMCLLVFQLDTDIDNFGDQVKIVEEASRRSEEASKRASQDLADALERSQSGDRITPEQLRQVVLVIFEIRDILCAQSPSLCETGG